ncbi:VaFE repeat-containing surface-anchored protein [Corynebacterium sp. LaCa54]|uniref:VaFE repeat-containing surface-anchored protein n=4 Tax=unclassified Corynebacterium TaxID=2624378 RepID=UPI00398A393A
MSRLKNISREGWMVFTAVLAAIAVIAAMVTVPGAKAEAAEPTDFTPNNTLGNELKKEEKDPQHFAADYSWGLLVWAGEPAGPGFGNGGNKNNDVGWGWCIEPHAKTPLNTREAYEKKNATKLEFDEKYHDAVINLGRKMEAAAARGDKKAAANYYVYLLMFLDSHQNPKNLPFETIVGNSKDYFPGFTGSHEEFTALTGYKIEGPKEVPELVKDPTVEIAKQPEDAFITVVHPNGNRNSKAQSVIPVDQPGLPDEPDNGGGSEEPTTSSEETSSDETTSENPGGETSPNETTENPEPSDSEGTTPKDTTSETTSENPGGETSPNETTENPEPSDSEGTTPKDTTSETTPDKTTDVTPNPEPTPTTSEQEKGLEPKIETEASIKDGNRVEKGATVIDTVTYKDLVPGREYTLKAELISKEDGESVLGTGEKTFKPEASNGKVEVEITVNDDVTEPVEAAVAFEELTSVEVDKNGKETPDATSEKPNHIAEHKDINDKDQTVTSEGSEKTPKISTNADFADGSHEVVAGAKVVDEVSYEGLVPGREYTLKAELISKEDGESVLGTGEKTFKPEASNGKVEVEITVNDDVTEPVEAAVAFEELTSVEVDKNGKETPDATSEKPNHIAEHKDINDKDQTVTSEGSEKTPKISTNADFADGSHEVVAGAKVVDEVSYEGLVPGREYTLKAELISKEDGESVLGTGEKTFKPEASNGKVEVEITVNDDVTEPVEAAVAFEELTSVEVDKNGKETPDATSEKPNHIAEHKDINDKDQTVTSEGSEKTPKISTNADFADGSHEVVAGAKVVDEVSYEGLVPGREYTLKAELISKEDGESVLGTGEKTFKPEASNGKVEVEITVNDDVTEPVEAAVAFEELTSVEVDKNGKETPDATSEKPNHIAEHKDINDKDQTVTSEGSEKTPKISTNADFADGSHEVVAGAKVVDEVSYEGLVPGREYTLKAELISKEDGESVLGTGEKTFKPEASNGKVEVEITVNDDVTEPVEAAVAFEELTSVEVDKNGKETPDATSEKPNHIAEHKDINDKDQTVTSEGSEKTPKISTNADFADGSHEVVAGAKVVDEVSYEGLVPGREYTLKAELISKEDGESVLGTGEKTFKPEASNGKVEVEITVNDDVTEPVEAAVAFEELTSVEVDKNGKETPDATSEKPNHIAEHKDINDKDQTVTSEGSEKTPKISTNADFADGSHEVVAGAKVVDEVSYEGLVPGREYTLKAELISKEDGESVLGTGEKTFKPEASNGKVEVEITVNDDVTEPVEAAVAFEELTSVEVDKNGKETPDATSEKPNHIAEHKDINDKDQTVTSEGSEKTPKISTNADFADGSHEVVAGAKVVDEVSYEGLVPGREYTLKAELISKEDGESVLGTGEKTFKPEASNGKVEVEITVNDDVTEPVEAAVAFEELTSVEVDKNGKETPDATSEKPNHIAEHKDINDKDQTVTSHEVHDQDTPGGSSKGKIPWWLILIPGIGLGKIIKDHFDHKDHGNHNGGHGDNTGNHDGGNGKHTDGHNGGNGHEVKGQDAPKGGNSDNGHGHGIEVQGQQPEETGNALPSNADRVEIKSVPSGATELEPGMQDYIK